MSDLLTKNRMVASPVPGSTYAYRLRSTGQSSAHFGPCEVCLKSVSDVFLQAEGRVVDDIPGEEPFVSMGNTRFGHEACLRRKQR